MLSIKKTNASVFSLSIVYCICLLIFENSFKVAPVVAVGFVLGLYILTKDFFISLFTIFVLSSFFLLPAKIYRFEYESASQYVYELLKEGLFDNITIDIADLCNIALFIWFIRERIVGSKSFSRVLNTNIVILVLCSWFVYFSFSFFSVLNYSILPAFSFNLLLKYSKILSVFLGSVYFLVVKKSKQSIFFTTLISVLVFQSVIGILQFSNSLTIYGQSEKLPSLDTEERTGFSRVKGISNHPNTHALTTILLCLMVLPFLLKEKGKFSSGIIVLSIFNVSFSQSRSIWIACLLPLIFTLFIYRRSFMIFARRFVSKKRATTMILLTCGMLFIIISPRLSTITTFFTSTGGGNLRIKMISQGWQLLQQSPWTGFGMGMDVKVFLNRFQNSYAKTFPFPIHFAYLQIAIESGIIAAVAFFFPIYLVVRSSISLIQKKTTEVVAILACVMIMLQYYLVQPIYGRREYIFIGLLIGIGSALILNNKIRESNHVNS